MLTCPNHDFPVTYDPINHVRRRHRAPLSIGAYGYGYAKLDPTGEFDYNDPAIEEFLDQERDFGYGTVGHNPLWAWTERYVIVTEVYDGSTGFMAVPLAPDTPGEPDFIGGH